MFFLCCVFLVDACCQIVNCDDIFVCAYITTFESMFVIVVTNSGKKVDEMYLRQVCEK